MYNEYDWSKTLAWLEAHPTANPGGWPEEDPETGELIDCPDLFDMPLPEGFPEPEGEEWTGVPYWGEQGEPPGIRWFIGSTGWSVVMPGGDNEPFVMAPDGTVIQKA